MTRNLLSSKSKERVEVLFSSILGLLSLFLFVLMCVCLFGFATNVFS